MIEYIQNKTQKSLYFKKVLGETIRELRINQTGLSSNKLANEYDIGNGNLSRIENGIVECKFITLWKISEALGIDFADFAKIFKSNLGKDFYTDR